MILGRDEHASARVGLARTVSRERLYPLKPETGTRRRQSEAQAAPVAIHLAPARERSALTGPESSY